MLLTDLISTMIFPVAGEVGDVEIFEWRAFVGKRSLLLRDGGDISFGEL